MEKRGGRGKRGGDCDHPSGGGQESVIAGVTT
jgi:hypothetical protein